MRRTPVGFEKEEEAHLQKMLDAGVIKLSISEWASAPDLVRKRDGGVRWCIDIRMLNSRSVKDVFPPASGSGMSRYTRWKYWVLKITCKFK